MKIYIGSDHNGFELKKHLSNFLKRSGHEVIDEGNDQLNPEDDFPQFAGRVVNSMLGDKDIEAKGILICGSGQGMAIAANRFKGIRASLAWDMKEARMARNDNDSNILCLPARVVDERQAEAITNAWLNTPFAGAARFKRRIREVDNLN